MKKLLVGVVLGYVLTCAMHYGASCTVRVMQQKCYPLWTEGNKAAYQTCMDNETELDLLSRVLGFDIIYVGRDLILGY